MVTTPPRLPIDRDHQGLPGTAETKPNGYVTSVLGDVRRLLDGSGTLIRQELELMRAEARQQVDRYVKASAAMGMGVALAMAGLVVLLLGISVGAYALLVAAGLDRTTAGWLGPVLVGAIVLTIGGVMVGAAKKKLSEPPSLTRTVQEAERTAAWAKEKV